MIPIDKTELFDNALLKILDANNTPWGLQAQALCMQHPDFAEAHAAFKASRAPKFKGAPE